MTAPETFQSSVDTSSSPNDRTLSFGLDGQTQGNYYQDWQKVPTQWPRNYTPRPMPAPYHNLGTTRALDTMIPSVLPAAAPCPDCSPFPKGPLPKQPQAPYPYYGPLMTDPAMLAFASPVSHPMDLPYYSSPAFSFTGTPAPFVPNNLFPLPPATPNPFLSPGTSGPGSTPRPPRADKGKTRQPREKHRPRGKPVRSTPNPVLPAPLSLLAAQHPHAPVHDTAAYVNRSAAARQREAYAKGQVVTPPNSFVLYRCAYKDVMRAVFGSRPRPALMALFAQSWRMEPAEVRDRFTSWAARGWALHREAFPAFKRVQVYGQQQREREEARMGFLTDVVAQWGD
ncbi:hypothetical protein F4780DRAFT_78997 [Xylariomycetidae sp. FL0641]|nr:hypothetical protein F4780DRAFT_78997 [Xylariomycetidae sp. FL0641]